MEIKFHQSLRFKTYTKKCFVLHYIYCLHYNCICEGICTCSISKNQSSRFRPLFFYISVVDFGKNVILCFVFILLNKINENNKAKRNIKQLLLHGENILSTYFYVGLISAVIILKSEFI